MIIYNAEVHTMEDHVYAPGYVRIQGDKIVAAGVMPSSFTASPSDHDACGGCLYPGFIDSHCHLGMWQDSQGFEGDDGNEDTDPCTPQLRGLDGVKVDASFAEALRWGITTVVTGPGSTNPIGGQLCALKTYGYCVDDMVCKAPLAMKFALGENPKHTYRDKEQGPVTRMGVASVIRDNLAKAKRYQEQTQRAQSQEDYDEPEYDGALEALGEVLSGNMGSHFHAHMREDIFTALRIAREFGLRPVLVHATDAASIAVDLASRKTPVILGPLLGARTKPELRGLSLKTPGILERAGVQTALCSDYPEQSIDSLLLTAYLAVQNGMTTKAAMEAITSVPAKICGLWDKLGSIAPGKDADLALFARSPLEVPGVAPECVWINGKMLRSSEAGE